MNRNEDSLNNSKVKHAGNTVSVIPEYFKKHVENVLKEGYLGTTKMLKLMCKRCLQKVMKNKQSEKIMHELFVCIKNELFFKDFILFI